MSLQGWQAEVQAYQVPPLDVQEERAPANRLLSSLRRQAVAEAAAAAAVACTVAAATAVTRCGPCHRSISGRRHRRQNLPFSLCLPVSCVYKDADIVPFPSPMISLLRGHFNKDLL